MQARSALFDLYGDHLRSRNGHAPVAALVRLLAPLGIAAPAVRTAVSRMVREGWLIAAQNPRGYALTEPAVRRLDDAAARIYRTRNAGWDGQWRLMVIDPPSTRSARERLRAGLRFLGYAPMTAPGWSATWLATRHSVEVDTMLETEGVSAERFTAHAHGDPAALLRRVWDLDSLAEAYDTWLGNATVLLRADPGDLGPDETAFATRSLLVHEWRKFLFQDPGLPHELLPDNWSGHRAAAFFDAEADRLRPAATRFVDACLAGNGP